MSNLYETRLASLSNKLRKDPGLPKSNPTESYWQQPPLQSVAQLQSPALPKSTDVVIIGSGITGCSVAHQLLQDPSIKVTILEARDTTSGATGRNGGHIKAIPEHAHEDLRPFLSLKETKEVMHFALDNVQALLQLAETLSPQLKVYSEVRAVESLELFTNIEAFEHFKKVVSEFEREDATLRGRGKFVPAESVSKAYGFTHAAGGYLHPAGAAWPYRLITGLLDDMLRKNKSRFTLEAQTPVLSINSLSNGTYEVKTPRGSIVTKYIVHATNGHSGHLNPGIRGALFPVRGQMTAQIPTERFGTTQGGKRSWGIHYGIGYDYMTASGKSGEIFLGGGLAQAEERGVGEIGNVNDDTNSPLALAHLGGILNSVSGIGKNAVQSHIKAAWTGVMGFTGDALPFVGKLPREASLRSGSGEFISAGFNGWGMSNAWLCGKHVADLILQSRSIQPIPSTYVISPDRLARLRAEDGAKIWLKFLGLDDGVQDGNDNMKKQEEVAKF
ncbi:FAD dependent oxidoreductase [Acrodontium crateriforme]|uniref:FAD dependent oxidoreductase n=1 Tax=Acrodontium crateriforme TaxID=150365 RepID=A0AAQ3MBG3_9PEZI|nr:FAD dependent oxidoreductase [Acrodontium crateriforme]